MPTAAETGTLLATASRGELRVDGDTGWGSCLERHTSEGESPDPQPLRSSVVRALGCHESGCLGLQLHAGWYTSFKAAGMMNIRTGPTAHK